MTSCRLNDRANAWDKLEQVTVGVTPQGELYNAIKHGDVESTRQALRSGADACAREGNGKSYLRIAGELGHREVCDLLIRSGADPNEVSGARRYSLLHNAAAAGNYGFVAMLVDHGANASPKTINGLTPLHFAARNGHGYLMQKLIDGGAELDVQDKQGRTPLFLAVEKGHTEAVRRLLKAGANQNIRNKKGMTGTEVAEKHELTEILASLNDSPNTDSPPDNREPDGPGFR